MKVGDSGRVLVVRSETHVKKREGDEGQRQLTCCGRGWRWTCEGPPALHL